MLSRAEVRSAVETVLRVVSIGILAWMFVMSLQRGRPDTMVTGTSTSLLTAARDWSRAGLPPNRISVRLDRSPSPGERDWLGALRGAGSEVHWSGELLSTGVSVLPIVAPRGGWTVFAAAPSGTMVRVSDGIGSLDSAVARGGGASFRVPSVSGDVIVAAGTSIATATAGNVLVPGRVLVLGTAGWESRFVVTALEEDGWRVDADILVAPGIAVTQGSRSSIDTARYAAVVALDGTAASRAGEIGRYAASGGGVVLAGAAAAASAFASLRVGVPGRAQSVAAMESEPGSVTLSSLAFLPFAALRDDAVLLERRSGSGVIAVRRHGAGRILQHGYMDTWRWRMSGGHGSPAEHREWWTGAVASVAYAPMPARVANSVVDPAPVAGLIEALGPPSASPSSKLANVAGAIPLWWWFALLSFCLLAEWASRRLRGLR